MKAKNSVPAEIYDEGAEPWVCVFCDESVGNDVDRVTLDFRPAGDPDIKLILGAHKKCIRNAGLMQFQKVIQRIRNL